MRYGFLLILFPVLILNLQLVYIFRSIEHAYDSMSYETPLKVDLNLFLFHQKNCPVYGAVWENMNNNPCEE